MWQTLPSIGYWNSLKFADEYTYDLALPLRKWSWIRFGKLGGHSIPRLNFKHFVYYWVLNFTEMKSFSCYDGVCGRDTNETFSSIKITLICVVDFEIQKVCKSYVTANCITTGRFPKGGDQSTNFFAKDTPCTYWSILEKTCGVQIHLFPPSELRFLFPMSLFDRLTT